MKKVVTVLFSITVLFFVSACNGGEVSITDVSFDQSVLESSYEIADFSIEDYFLTVTFSDGTSKHVAITEAMISSSDLAKLSVEGSQTIEVLYEGFRVSLSIELVDLTQTYSITFLDWNNNVLGVEYYPFNENLEELSNAPEASRYGYNFLLWREMPQKMPSNNITVQATYVSWWDVFRSYMIDNGVKTIETNGVWYKVEITLDENEYYINYNDANYDKKIFSLNMTHNKIIGSSSQSLILEYLNVFNTETDYFYSLYDSNGNSVGYGMGPNTYVSLYYPEIEFMFTDLNVTQINEAENDLKLLLNFFSQYFLNEIEIPLI